MANMGNKQGKRDVFGKQMLCLKTFVFTLNPHIIFDLEIGQKITVAHCFSTLFSEFNVRSNTFLALLRYFSIDLFFLI